MAETAIEWARNADGSRGCTWNPTRGCRRVDRGCKHCYAERLAGFRLSGEGMPYEGLVTLKRKGSTVEPSWTGDARLIEGLLDQPLRWRKPRTIFVDSMSDLFFEPITDTEIARVFGVMAQATWHTFQVLTRRIGRARTLLDTFTHDSVFSALHAAPAGAPPVVAADVKRRQARRWPAAQTAGWPWLWPLPNVWLGTSVIDQETADERVAELVHTKAAVRFVSYEPALGPVSIRKSLERALGAGGWGPKPPIDWMIVGGESGPRELAEPFDIRWMADITAECRALGILVFTKQLGTNPYDGFALCNACGHARNEHAPQLPAPCWNGVPEEVRMPRAITRGWVEAMNQRPGCKCLGFVGTHADLKLKHHKGADLLEWPSGLAVRETPRLTP